MCVCVCVCVCVFKERIESVSTEDSLVWSEREQGPKEAVLKRKRGSRGRREPGRHSSLGAKSF